MGTARYGEGLEMTRNRIFVAAIILAAAAPPLASAQGTGTDATKRPKASAAMVKRGQREHR